MRHLILIATSFPIDNDGSEAAGSFVVDLASTLARNIKVTVVAPGPKKIVEIVSPHLEIHRFYAPLRPLSLLKVRYPLHWRAIITTLASGNAVVRDTVKKNVVDHILALWVLPSGYWAKTNGKKFNIPYSTWALGSDIWSLGKTRILRNILREVLSKSYCNFADGYQLGVDVEKISRKTCIFLPTTRNISISNKTRNSRQAPYRFAFLGRWHHNKGIDLLTDSLSLLRDSDWVKIEEVKIYGGGFLKKYVEHSVKSIRKQGRPVSIGGYLNKKEAVELFRWADYVLIPSRIESIPVVFSDAMKCGCPVVCMPVGDLPQLIIENNVGVLAENISAEAFAKAIRVIMHTGPEVFSESVAKAAELFSLDRVCQLLEDRLFPHNS